MNEIEVQYLPIDELQPADYNPRIDLKDGDTEFEKLKNSINQFGFIDPIIYNTRTNRIIGGHQRWKAAKSLGMETVPVVKVDLPEEQEKVLNIGLNKIGGAFDDLKLGELLASIEHLDGDMLGLTGFDDFEIDALITSIEMDNQGVMNGLDEFMNNDDDEDDLNDENDDDDDDFTTPEGFVKYQVACLVEEREVIVKAVNEMKKHGGIATSNQALAEICQLYLSAKMEE